VRTALGRHSRHPHADAQSQTGPEQVLYSFQGGLDGNGPQGAVTFDSKGNLYGTTILAGAGGCTDIEHTRIGCGSIFELSPNGSGGWTETILYSFQAGNDGNRPGGLLLDQKGNLYGTTAYGGGTACFANLGCGTVFELSPNGSGGWTETVLYDFKGGADGDVPNGGLILDQSGNLYGTTVGGGSGHCAFSNPECGTVFELSPNGSGGWTETVLHSFGPGPTDGNVPTSPLTLDPKGNLYGTTSSGGDSSNCNLAFAPGCGTVFELSPNGSGGWTETILYNFQGDTDGEVSMAGLVFDQAGNLYGTTSAGGLPAGCVAKFQAGCGTVFELSPSGSGGWTETILYRFQPRNDSALPMAGLIFDQAGNLYGTATFGGSSGAGTAFELSPNASGGWTETILYSFSGGSDGASPFSPVIFDQSGNAYGTTLGGGGVCCGVVYELSKEPFAAFSPTGLSFGNQTPGVSSSPQATTLTNSGRLPLTITSIQIAGANSGDFSQTNNCPASLAPFNSCKISVTFTPTAGGNRSAELQVADNAPGSPQTAALSGTGEDFSVAVTSQTSVTVTPGQAANYAIAVSPVNGLAQKVALSCSGAPPQSTCTVTPSSVTLDGTHSAPASVSVVTSRASADLVYPAGFSSTGIRLALWIALPGLPGLLLLGGGGGGSGKRRRVLYGLLLLSLLAATTTWFACGGGSGGGGSSGGGGTPGGTYTLTVTGTFTSGSAVVKHSVPLTLIVQ
jgi:uncharacterized repeat protein (TIGR03803 family)